MSATQAITSLRISSTSRARWGMMVAGGNLCRSTSREMLADCWSLAGVTTVAVRQGRSRAESEADGSVLIEKGFSAPHT